MTRYRRHADIRLTALEGEGVVLHMGARRYFTVNETGLTILEALTQPQSFAQLVDAVTAEYEVTQEKAEQSVKAFVDQCVASAVIIEESA
ncbi:MAG: PqqD family protein [Gemmatimonadaceae bacterium]